jgi:biopolymer transport protein ExbB
MNVLQVSIWEQGGPLIWPLLALSFIGCLLFVERTLYLHQGKIRAADFLEGIKNLVKKDRLLEAITVCQETDAPVAHVVKAALLNHDRDAVELRCAIQEAALLQLPQLERRLSSIAMISRVAPMIGLLGTVLALLGGFLKMQTVGPYADIALFAPNVVQALMTTALGLFISVLGFLGYNFLFGRVKALVYDLEWAANAISLFLLSEIHFESKDILMDEPSRNDVQ